MTSKDTIEPIPVEEEHQMGRLRIVKVSGVMLSHLMIEGWEPVIRCVEGLPHGAELVNFDVSRERVEVGMVFRHDSFDPVPGGEMIPEQKVLFTTIRLDEVTTEAAHAKLMKA
jgi:hypothetical protein